jgi:hypothetical protein
MQSVEAAERAFHLLLQLADGTFSRGNLGTIGVHAGKATSLPGDNFYPFAARMYSFIDAR